MTPKEKAKELMDEMFKHIQYAAYPYPTKAVIAAKNCALIVVEEMKLVQNLVSVGHKEGFIKYCNEVKQEIEKL